MAADLRGLLLLGITCLCPITIDLSGKPACDLFPPKVLYYRMLVLYQQWNGRAMHKHNFQDEMHIFVLKILL